jgi:CheY-specific phosphatase CheX
MNNKVTEALTRAAGLTFEELGFLFPTCETAPSDTANFRHSVVVNFHGDGHGTMVLNVSPELLPVIAENILGDDETSEEIQMDALGEVANVICGNVLLMVFGKSSVIRMDAPEHGEFTSADECAGEIRLGFDEGCADVMLYLNEGK